MKRKSIYGVELIRGEEIIDSFHPTFLRFITHYLLSITFIIIGGLIHYYNINLIEGVDSFIYLLYITGSGVIWLVLTLIANNAELLVISNERIIYKKGVFNINTPDVDVDKIQNMKVHQTFFQRMFNFGTLSIDTSGGEGYEIIFEGVPKISRKRAVIKSVMERDEEVLQIRKKTVITERKKILEDKKKEVKKLEDEIKKIKK